MSGYPPEESQPPAPPPYPPPPPGAPPPYSPEPPAPPPPYPPYAPEPPTAEGAGGGTVDGDDILPPTPGAPPPGGRRRAPLVAAIVVALVLVAGGVGAAVALTSSSGGNSTPEAAVHALFTAAGKVDALGALDAIDPDERSALEPGLQEIWGQLKRLGILSSNADLTDIKGISLDLPSLRYTTKALGSDLDEVTVTAGGADVHSSVTPKQLPIGPVVKSFSEVRAELEQGGSEPQSAPFGTVKLATVKDNGNWYVSIGYSVAVNDLLDAGHSAVPPPASTQVPPVGSSSPTQVVKAMASAAEKGDLTGVIAQLDPQEMGAADAYAYDWLTPLAREFKTEIAKARREVSEGKVKIGAVDWDLVTKQVALGTLVMLGPHFSFSAQEGGNKVSYANGCETVTASGHTQKTCTGAGGSALEKYMPAPVRPIIKRLEGSTAQMGLVMTKVNGRWYLSITRTFYQTFVALLSSLERTDFATVENNVGGIEKGYQRYARSLLQGFGVNTPSLSGDVNVPVGDHVKRAEHNVP